MRIRSRRAQGLAEYIIIVALIAIAAIGVVALFGDNIRILFASSSNALDGDEEIIAKTQGAHQRHLKAKNLKDFAQDNQGGH